MSAKFLQVFTDENPEMQKQTGCMTGIFQMFERQHILNGRRINGHNHKRHPSGHSLSASASLGAEHGSSSPRIVLEKNQSLNENQRISMESSRTSFSSSSCSSFSSLEYNKSTQQEPLLFDETIFPHKSSKSSPRLKTPNADGRPPRYELRSDPPNASVQTARRSLDFRDVVKDSISRDSRGLSLKTSPKREVKNHEFRHGDSPRPMQLSKSTDGSHVLGISGESRESVDHNESLRVLVKLKEAPWKFSEAGESPRTSFEAKPASFYPEYREAHRFSFDRIEISRQSLDSRENSKLPSNLRELPRLSLDSREGSLRNSNFEPKSNSVLKDLDRSNSNQRVSTTSNLEQELGSHKCSASAVAKLMGLETMPSLNVVPQDPIYRSKDCAPSNEQKPKPLKASQDNWEDWLSSPKRSIKDRGTPRIKDPDSKMKSISNSGVPIETTPWRQQEKHHVPQKAEFMHREAQAKQQPGSVYSEIERRLKELEFRQSNKDLRALKQILDAMKEKGLLGTKKDEQETRDNQSLRSVGVQNQTIIPLLSTLTKGSINSGTFESPIVIMKPANSVKRSGMPPYSVVPLEGLSGIQKLHTRATMDKKKISTNHRMDKDQPSNATLKKISGKKTSTRIEDDGSLAVRPRTVQVLSRPQQSSRENSGSSLKTSGSLSPRRQQKQLEAERSTPPHPSSDLSKPRRPSANKKPLDSVSPRGKLRQKPAQVQDSDGQLSESSETRNFSYQGDEISQRSDSNISMSSQADVEATSADQSAHNCVFQKGSRSPSGRDARKAASVKKPKKPPISLSGEVPSMEFLTAAPEQPSPIFVLDASFYQDDLPQSPPLMSLNSPKDAKNQTSDDSLTPSRLLGSPTNTSCSEINQKKLQSIENLVQKPSQQSSTDDRNSTTDHIALLCETQDPDHRYLSEILLASGLLLKDLSGRPMGPIPIQLHPSGHPINPDLFLVLEQTKMGWLSKPETINEKTLRSKTDQEKLHRKLVFDVVNEVLIQKLERTSSGHHPEYLARSRKLTDRFPIGRQLLKELCLEIEQLQDETARDENSDVEIKISEEEVLHRSEGWADFDKEVPGVVLEIERLIFKDLIDEVVSGESAVSSSQLKSSWRRRQLIVK